MKKILGLGNALVDIITEINDEKILDKFNLPKGSMMLVDQELSKIILENTEHFPQTMASGGSAANTIHGLSRLNVHTGFIGKTGDDELGKFFKKDISYYKINPHMLTTSTNTGKAIALITEDAERTFATYLGAAIELSPEDLDREVFKQYDMLYIEGYIVQNHLLLEQALKTAKECGLEIVLDLASYNVVDSNLDFLQKMVEQYVDIVFANEEEAKSFTGIDDPEKAIGKIGEKTKLAIVKIGKKGSLILNNNKMQKIDAKRVNSIDTTGAGDLYASGFLYGYINNMNLNTCGEIGNLLAQEVIQNIGAKVKEDNWGHIKYKISEIS